MDDPTEVYSVPVKGEKLEQIVMPFVVPVKLVLPSQECSVQPAKTENP